MSMLNLIVMLIMARAVQYVFTYLVEYGTR